MTFRVAVVGSGYVGTVVASCLAHIGHEVVGLDTDPERRAALMRGRAPFYEPGLDPLLQAGIESGRLRFTDEVDDAIGAADIVFLCVGTPSGDDGRADMRFVEAAAHSVAAALDRPKLLVTKSTVPIGSGHWLESIVEDALQQHRGRDIEFSVASNPEFLRQGAAVHDYLHPDRVVLGSDDPIAVETLRELYEPILTQAFAGGDSNVSPALVCTRLTTAETVKYVSNAFL